MFRSPSIQDFKKLLRPNKYESRRTKTAPADDRIQKIVNLKTSRKPGINVPNKGTTLKELIENFIQNPCERYSRILLTCILDLVTLNQLLVEITDCLLLNIRMNQTVVVERIVYMLVSISNSFHFIFDSYSHSHIAVLLKLVRPVFKLSYYNSLIGSIKTMEFFEHRNYRQHSYPIIDLLHVDTYEIASEIMAIDSHYFKNIMIHEFLDLQVEERVNCDVSCDDYCCSFEMIDHRMLDASKAAGSFTSSVDSSITLAETKSCFDRFNARANQMSIWVTALITTSINPIAMLQKLIQLACILIKLNNFNSAMALFVGFGDYRVVKMKEFIPLSDRISYANLEYIFNPASDFKKYRQAIKTCTDGIPLLMIVMKDIFAVKETHSKIINGLVNFERAVRLYDCLSHTLMLQKSESILRADLSSRDSTPLFMSMYHLCTIPYGGLIVHPK